MTKIVIMRLVVPKARVLLRTNHMTVLVVCDYYNGTNYTVDERELASIFNYRASLPNPES